MFVRDHLAQQRFVSHACFLCAVVMLPRRDLLARKLRFLDHFSLFVPLTADIPQCFQKNKRSESRPQRREQLRTHAHASTVGESS